MKVTMEADYAIRIVYCLALSDQRLDAKTISQRMNITLRFSLKILRKLVMKKIIKSFKGVNGGYSLNTDPSLITLKDVVEAVDGPIMLNKCLSGDNDCSRLNDKADCPFHIEFKRLNEMLSNEMSKITFGNLNKNINDKKDGEKQ